MNPVYVELPIIVGGFLSFVLIFTAGFGVGKVVGRKQEVERGDAARKAIQSEYVCGCEHHYALHDPVTGQCRGQDTHHGRIAQVIFDGNGEAVRRASNNEPKVVMDFPDCRCQRYSGNLPPEVILGSAGFGAPDAIGAGSGYVRGRGPDSVEFVPPAVADGEPGLNRG